MHQNEDKRTIELSGHVGFDSLPDQLVSKSVAQGFSFNILCVGMWGAKRYPLTVGWTNSLNSETVVFVSVIVLLLKGETGVGKSTLMNTLFNTTFENEEASHYENKVHLHPQTYELQESNVNLKLTIVHTVGFGDQINREERCVLVWLTLDQILRPENSNQNYEWKTFFNCGIVSDLQEE